VPAAAADYGAWHANLTAFVATNADLPGVAISVACAGILANPKIANRSRPAISICIASLNGAISTKQAGLTRKGHFAIP
jgi:hypothetical protein